MLDREKDQRLNDLLKTLAYTSKQMPEIVLMYFQNLENKKTLKPFYTLFAESFLSLYSFAHLYLNKAWSQASSILRTSIEQVSKLVVLVNNPKYIDLFIELRILSDKYYSLNNKEERELFLTDYNNDINEFNNYTEWGWAEEILNNPIPTRNDVIKLAGFGETLVDIRNLLNSFVHGNLSVFDFYSNNSNTEILRKYGRRITLICCKLFYLLYISFKNWKNVKDLSFETDEHFLKFKKDYKYLLDNYNN